MLDVFLDDRLASIYHIKYLMSRISLSSYVICAQAVLDEYRLRTEAAELELSRSERLLQEQVASVTELKAKRAESERQRMALLEKLQKALTDNAAAQGREGNGRELDLEVLKLTQAKEILERELSTLTKSLRSQKQINAEQMLEIDRLRGEVDRLQQEKDFFRRDMAVHESGRTELQLQELRKELTRTVDDWKESESTRESYEQSSGEASTRLEREKEKVGLLKTQVGLLEDRLDVMSQELAVFRSLDIYHNSMDAELRSYRNAAIAAASPSITASNRSARARSSSPISRSHSPLGHRHFADLSSSVDRRERELDMDKAKEDSSDDEAYQQYRGRASGRIGEHDGSRGGVRWAETTDDLLLSSPKHRTASTSAPHVSAEEEEDLGPALSMTDMSPSRTTGASRNHSSPYHYTGLHNSRDDITPSLSGSAHRGSSQREHRRSPSPPAGLRGGSPTASSRRLFDSEMGGRGDRREGTTHQHEQYRGRGSPAPSSRVSYGDYSPPYGETTHEHEQRVPKRESLSRPGLQLDGSLTRSSHHPVSTRERVATDNHHHHHHHSADDNYEQRAAESRSRGESESRGRTSGLLARSGYDNFKKSSSITNSKPSKVEFERAKKLLARR
jgi:hypothetical protein